MESSADSDAYQELLSNLAAALAPLQTLHQQAVETLAPTVREIIENRSRDPRSIEHTLAALRDTLLPKLLSGELSVAESTAKMPSVS